MRLMVLGASGFVGSAIVRRAAESGWNVAAVSRASTKTVRRQANPDGVEYLHAELATPAEVERVVRQWRPDVIVQAAFAAGHGSSASTPTNNYWEQGLAPALALTQALAAVGFQGTLVHAGSAMALGASGSMHKADDRLTPSTPRGVVKAACALLYEQAARATGFRLRELYILSVYGPWEQRGRLIPELLRAALSGRTLKMTPAGYLRNWIHVDDVASACLSAASTQSPAILRVIVGSSDGVTDTHDIARRLESLTGRQLVADFTLDVQDRYEDTHLTVDPAESLSSIGWQTRIGLETGLATTWEWAQSTTGKDYLLASS